MSAILKRLSGAWNGVVPPGPEGLVWWLTLLASVGVTSVMPLLPLYARESGADLRTIGWMAASYLLTNLLFLYAAGRLSDTVGRRPLMGVGLVGYALCSLGFMVWTSATGFIALRGIEGVAAACFLPAALAYVADRYPASERGLRIGQLAVAENLGLLLGPAFGGAIKTWFDMNTLFIVLTVMCAVGAVLVARLPQPLRRLSPAEPDGAASPGGDGGLEAPNPGAPAASVRRLLLAGVSARAAAGGFALGLYLTVWPIFMARDLHATDWDVSLSWTVFAVPALILGPFAGRLIDRHGPGIPTVVGAAFSALVVFTYGFSESVGMLISLCILEGIGFAFSYPAQNTLMVHIAPEALRGRVIGWVTGMRTFGTLVGSLVTPELFAISTLHAFGAVGIVSLLGACLLGAALLFDHRSKAAAALPHA